MGAERAGSQPAIPSCQHSAQCVCSEQEQLASRLAAQAPILMTSHTVLRDDAPILLGQIKLSAVLYLVLILALILVVIPCCLVLQDDLPVQEGLVSWLQYQCMQAVQPGMTGRGMQPVQSMESRHAYILYHSYHALPSKPFPPLAN